jgi:hypothetical protein
MYPTIRYIVIGKSTTLIFIDYWRIEEDKSIGDGNGDHNEKGDDNENVTL